MLLSSQNLTRMYATCIFTLHMMERCTNVKSLSKVLYSILLLKKQQFVQSLNIVMKNINIPKERHI